MPLTMTFLSNINHRIILSNRSPNLSPNFDSSFGKSDFLLSQLPKQFYLSGHEHWFHLLYGCERKILLGKVVRKQLESGCLWQKLPIDN